MLDKNLDSTLFIETHDIVGLDRIATFHTWRTDGHARDRNTLDIRSKQQQPFDVPVGNMPLDYISIDHGSMTGREFFRNTEALFDRQHVAGMLDGDVVIVILQVLYPLGATTALWILVNHDILYQAVAGKGCRYGQNT